MQRRRSIFGKESIKKSRGMIYQEEGLGRLFLMWLRTFNLEKLMWLNFRERFKFWHKGPELVLPWFFQKILTPASLGLILSKSFCNSH